MPAHLNISDTEPTIGAPLVAVNNPAAEPPPTVTRFVQRLGRRFAVPVPSPVLAPPPVIAPPLPPVAAEPPVEVAAPALPPFAIDIPGEPLIVLPVLPDPAPEPMAEDSPVAEEIWSDDDFADKPKEAEVSVPEPTLPVMELNRELQPIQLYYRLLARIEALEYEAQVMQKCILDLQSRTWWSMLVTQVKGWFK